MFHKFKLLTSFKVYSSDLNYLICVHTIRDFEKFYMFYEPLLVFMIYMYDNKIWLLRMHMLLNYNHINVS